MAYDHHTEFPVLMLPGCLKLKIRELLGIVILKQYLWVPVIWRCLMQRGPVGFRKKIAKDLYLIAKNVVTLKE